MATIVYALYFLVHVNLSILVFDFVFVLVVLGLALILEVLVLDFVLVVLVLEFVLAVPVAETAASTLARDSVAVESPVPTAPLTTVPVTVSFALLVMDLAVLFHIHVQRLIAPAPIGGSA